MNAMAENYTLEMDETEYTLHTKDNSLPLIQCSRIVCYNKSATMTKWVLESKSSTICLSPALDSNETWTFDLSTIEIPDGTQLILKSVSDNNRTSTLMLEYASDSNITVSFRLERTALNPLLVFLGTSLNRFKRL